MSTSQPKNGLPPQQPSLPWRITSSVVMSAAGAVSRVFLYGLNSVEVIGLDKFLEVVDERKDIDNRQRGLITVSNHVSIVDDPLIWGVLPFRYGLSPSNHRWSLGAEDICFQNKLLGSAFFSGQVLPTHRFRYSVHGGLSQPTMAQAIRLLSSQPFVTSRSESNLSEQPHDVPDPFTTGGLEYTTNGIDRWRAPSVYTRHRHSWVHVFPEACVHQHPKMYLRYFKWGVSRLILESEPMPDVLPIFFDGPQRVMPEDRGWPKFAPRFGTTFRIKFGDLLDADKKFGDLRARWQELVLKEKKTLAMGELTDELRYGREAVELRIEVARRVREEVNKVRKSMGYQDEDKPGFELAETWAQEPAKDEFKSNVDDSLVNKKE